MLHRFIECLEFKQGSNKEGVHLVVLSGTCLCMKPQHARGCLFINPLAKKTSVDRLIVS